MAKNTPKKPMTPFDKTLTAIIVVVILAVLAFAVFATYGKISGNIKQAAIDAETTAIQNGEQEATVRYMASNAGMSIEDYLAQYGLTLSGDLKEDSTMSEMTEQMTLENYYKFNDENSEETTDVDELLTKWGAEEIGITKDTLWSEVQDKLTIGKYLGDEDFNGLIEQYVSLGYDASGITADMTMKEANDAVEEMVKAGPVATEKPADDAEETEQAPEEASAE